MKAALPPLIRFFACLWLSAQGTQLPALRQLRDVAWESFLRLRGPQPPPEALALMAVTQEDLKAIGKWPWPRSTTAALFRRLAEARPQVAVPMFTYVSANRPKAHLLMRAMRRYPLLAIEESGLEAFIEAISAPFESRVENWLAVREPIVREQAPESLAAFELQRTAFLAEIRAFDTDPESLELVQALEALPTCLQNIAQLVDTKMLDDMGLQPGGAVQEFMPFNQLQVEGEWTARALLGVSRFEAKLLNFPRLDHAASCQGIFVASAAFFTTIWREPMVLRIDERLYPSLALAAVARFRGLSPEVRVREDGIQVWLGDERLPLDDGSGLWINYYGKAQPFRNMSSDRQNLRARMITSSSFDSSRLPDQIQEAAEY